MKSNKTALFGLKGVKFWESYSTVPLTQNGSVLYAHMTKKKYDGDRITITLSENPLSVGYLHDGTPAQYEYDKSTNTLSITLDEKKKDPLKLSTIVEIKTKTVQSFNRVDA